MPEEVLACRTFMDRDMRVRLGRTAMQETPAIPGLGPQSRLAAAIDIGTTTVKVSLVDVERAQAFPAASFLNPQHRYGHDVISRIAAAADPAVHARLGRLIRDPVRLCLENTLAASGIAGHLLETAVFSGNTTMLSLLFGLDVAPLGRYPYTAPVRDFFRLEPGSAGLAGLVRGEVHALPALSAFIGADLVGGLTLCSQAAAGKTVLFIDLGTNGELFCLDGRGRIFATSCAMGPALEGMNISWGMTADTGAITHVRQEAGGLAFDMMGNGEPAGITGTAVIDLLAILLDRGAVLPGGAFSPAMDLPSPLSLDHDGRSRVLRLWGPIRFTQNDVRNVQLAKAAALAASRFLLDAAGLRPGEIEHVFIAGAFGEHLDIDSFRRLGFIPPFGNARFSFLGNTSLKASEQACTDPDFLGTAATLRDRTEEIVLSERQGFQDAFIRAIAFPPGD
jgi:uncharacterized 2Fe-2S/4Fe-4S cluster protein (DUF4445 family)